MIFSILASEEDILGKENSELVWFSPVFIVWEQKSQTVGFFLIGGLRAGVEEKYRHL